MPAKLNFFRRLQEGQRIDHTSAIVLARVRTQTAGQKIRRHQLSLQLPNIPGQINPVCQHNWTVKPSGAFSYGEARGVTGGDFFTGNTLFIFNANSSDSIFGRAETVQPASLQLLPCIKT